jgi:hypothetical protein
MMDHHATKLRLQTLKLSSNQFSTSQIHSEVETISAYFVKDSSGLTILTRQRFQLTLTLELLLKLSLKVLRMRSHGTELSKNILFCKLKIDSQLDHMDGQMLDIQELKDLSIAQLVVMFALEELLLMLILKLVFMQELTSQEPMLR